VGLQIGFSLANVVNPLTSDHASLIDQFYTLLSILVFLAINGHHALLLAARQTFDLVPLGSQNVGIPAGTLILGWGSQLFVVALRISLPLMAALLLADLSLAIIARSVPQLNVFVVGMPAKLVVGFAMLAITVPMTAMLMARLFEEVGNSTVPLLRSMVH
jgi:flagellar biosynthetic protein FliR